MGIQLATVLSLGNESDYCLYWINPIEVKQLIAVQRCN
jgi:hypothetical protein